MTIDAHKNFAYTTVATAPSPATSGTSLVVVAGKGALFPTAPFNVVVWPTGVPPIGTNAEIARVTGISTDTFTITRAQEGTSARSIIVGDQIALTPTAKMFTDIEAALAVLQLKIVGGVVADDGTIVNGSVFTSNKDTGGTYTVTFSPTLTTIPAVVVTPHLGAAQIGSIITAYSSSAFTVEFRNASSTLVDKQFSFIAWQV